MAQNSEETPATDAPAPEPAKSKKLILIGAGAAALLLAGGGGAWFLTADGGDKAADHGEEAAASDHDGGEGGGESGGHGGEDALTSLIDVPPLITNMRVSGSESAYLKLRFMLQATSAENAAEVKTRLPAIIDSFQPFLRELRPEDLAGAAAVYRIKEELLFRTHSVVGKGKVEDLLIQDLLQQ